MKNLESGRSMVEMLGVLAIIGVLSIGGIAGYTIAMNRWRANEILDTAAKLSVIAITKGTQSTDATATFADLDMTGKKVGGQATNMTATSAGVVTIEGTLTDGVKSAMESIAGKNKYDSSTGVINLIAE
ncbi:MAG: hypothetical protein LBU87_00580 [Lactobacillales bacterium]|nr:hypothetical protein [Lactobacillales bacterium]